MEPRSKAGRGKWPDDTENFEAAAAQNVPVRIQRMLAEKQIVVEQGYFEPVRQSAGLAFPAVL